MNNQLSYGTSARLLMKSGADKLANAVKVTLGPKGRNVTIQYEHGKPPKITKDGVTVAQSIQKLENQYEDMGAQMVKEAARKTAIQAGDGTTTATLLAQVMIRDGMEYLSNGGTNPVGLKRGMDAAVECVVQSLKRQSTAIGDDNTRIKSIATISANNDETIGTLIADAMEQVGADGMITVEESRTAETTIELVNGFQFDRGYISHHFVTHPDKMQVVFDHPLILIYDRKISELLDIKALLESAAASKKPLLIIAEDIDREALSTMVVNAKRGGIQFCAVKSPGIGASRKAILDDIAAITGTAVISEDVGTKLVNTTLKNLGTAERLIVTRDTTTIIGGGGDKQKVKDYIHNVRTQLDDCQGGYEKPLLEKRLARLTNGLAILRVGAATDLELREKKDRIDDALHATRAAVEEGILPGGGTAYLRAMQPLELLEVADDAEKAGVEIVRKALKEPLIQILLNAGYDDNKIVAICERVQYTPQSDGYGYNAKTEEYANLLATGIIDPTKVARVAIENAESIASMFLTTECCVIGVPEK